MSQLYATPSGVGDENTGQPADTVTAYLDCPSSALDVQPTTEKIDLNLLKNIIVVVYWRMKSATDSSRLEKIWDSELSKRVLLLASENASSLEEVNTFFMSASKLCGVQKIKDCYKDVLKHITSEINSLRMQNPIIDDEKLYSIPSDVVKEARRSVFAFTQASWRRITIKQCLNELSVKSESSLCEQLGALSESLYAEKQIEDFIKQAELAKEKKGKKAALGKWKSIWKELEKKFAEMPSETNDDSYFCDESKQWKDKTLEKFKGEMEVSFKKMKIIKIDHSSLQEHVQKLKDIINADNCTLLQSSRLFTRKKDATQANQIRKVLYSEEKKASLNQKESGNYIDFFQLILDYITYFNWTESDKKERIELFLDNLVVIVRKRKYVFAEKLDQLHQHIISLAESYFVRINTEQLTIELWTIINNLHSKHFPNDTAGQYDERFKKIIRTLDALKLPDSGLRALSEHEFFSRTAKHTMNSFVDQLNRIIQNSFEPATSDGDSTSDTIVPHKFRDITKYCLKMMLIENVLPVAKNCLYVVRIQNSLQNFLEIPEESFRKKLENFNKDITEKVYDDRKDAKVVFFEKLNSYLDKHCQLQGKVSDVWKSFDQSIIDLLNIESVAPNASGLLKQKLRDEIQVVFEKNVR